MSELTKMWTIGVATGMMATPILKDMFKNLKELVATEKENKKHEI